jgi:hypothetical protein
MACVNRTTTNAFRYARSLARSDHTPGLMCQQNTSVFIMSAISIVALLIVLVRMLSRRVRKRQGEYVREKWSGSRVESSQASQREE